MDSTIAAHRSKRGKASPKGRKRAVGTTTEQRSTDARNREVTEARARLLALIAEHALDVIKRGFASKHDQAFKDVLENARVNNVITDSMVASLGKTSRPNASRWIHGDQFPHVHTQERVLLGVVRIAERRWRNLLANRKEEDGLDIDELSQISLASLENEQER